MARLPDIGNRAAAVARTLKAGLSGRVGLQAFRAAGGRIADGTWFRLVGEARRVIGENLNEAGRPLNRRPTGDEIVPITSTKASGYWQQVEVFYRDRVTGDVSSAPFVFRGSGLLTRQGVIDMAMAEWTLGSSGSPNPDDHEVLGATYSSTLELRPEF